MRRRRHKPEEIVAKLRQVDVLTTQGRSVAEAIESMQSRGVRHADRRTERFSLSGWKSG
jgi:hypothetical protein